jgi:hypothetical protein
MENKTLRIVAMTGWMLFFALVLLIAGRYGYLHSDSDDLKKDTPIETPTPQTYVQRGSVIDLTDNTTTIVTTDGYEWLITDDEYKVGDTLEITFSDEGTIEVYDDRIVSINKIN